MRRREFIQSTTGAGGALLLNKFSISDYKQHHMNNNFMLYLLATNWGYEGSLDQYCSAVKKEGYDGIEIWWPTEKKDQDELFTTLKKYDLKVGFLVAGHESNFEKHFNSFRKMIDAAAHNTVQKPLYINCHSGRDYFSFEDNKKIVDYTLSLATETGLKILHETHRSRMLFASSVAKHFMETVPQLRLTFDVSHWCNVSESLLQDQPEILAMAIQRADHIHARIGHPEGPQVNDPRAPEWKDALDAHLSWWDQIIDLKKKANDTMTILTEFGPPDYMPTVPYTRQPLADQWNINVYMMQFLRKRYQS